ncbi:MAG: hypothetical protein LBH17_07285, partial [Oscillospiraceae bacterium]|nr:hypothetical protein [Oscillospiraceae bacterium]
MKSALKKERKSIAILTAAVIVFLAVSAAAVYLSVNADTAGPGGEMPRVDEVIIPDPEPPLAYFEPEPEASPEPEPEFVAASAWTPDADTLARAAELLSAMTDEEKLYQMLFVTPEALTGYTRVYQAGQATRIALEKYPVGGIVYFERNIDSPEQTREMLTKTQEMAKIPMFLGVDEEGGRVARISSQSAMGYDALPPMAELGASGDSAKA